jgi:hypothetical protein
MIDMNQTMNKYLTQLIIIGIVVLIVGIIFVTILLKATANDPLINLPFGILGAVFGYLVVILFAPGAFVNLYLTPHVLTNDEKAFNNLVIKFRSKPIITIVITIFIALETFFAVFKHNPRNTVSMGNVIWLLIWAFLTTYMLGTGVKNISAWWNIRKKLK